MPEPKLTVIGAGSLFFGRQAIWQMVHSKHLNNGTLALVDSNTERLQKLHRLAEMVIAETGVGLKLEVSSNWQDVLPDSDFVVLSFARDTVKYRGIDCQVSEKYGIRMCSGDTIGPGGVFRAMRELPLILNCAKDIEALCPEAWVINYINPATVNGIALRRYAPKLKSFALCDGLHMPHVKRRYALRAGIIKQEADYNDAIDERFKLDIAGVNHFNWVLKAEFEGQELSPKIAQSLRQDAALETDGGDLGAKAKFNSAIGYQLYEAFGYIPANVSHTKEYLPYWQGLGKTAEAIPPLSIWETEDRYKRHAEMWTQIDDFISGKIPIEQYMTTFGPDHATDIVETMVGNLGKAFYLNTFNEGAVTNMAEDAFLELLCDLDMEGIKPREVGPMPRGLKALQELVLDTHELTADGVANCNLKLIRRALLIDPLSHSIADTDALIAELLALERPALSDCWFD